VLLIFDRRCKRRNVAVCGTILGFFLLFFLFFGFEKQAFKEMQFCIRSFMYILLLLL